MTFTDGSILLGLAALAIPLAIHLLGRRKARLVLLPTARFAEGAHRAARGWMRLKRFGLLALRLAAVALVVLALAGPRLGGATGARPTVRLAVCLDTSPSMATREGNTTRYAQARQALLDLLEEWPSDQPVWFASCGEDVRRVSPASLRAALSNDALATWREEPLGSLLARVSGALPQESQAACLVILTDATPWALRDVGVGQFADVAADVVVVPVGGDVRNGRLDLPQTMVVETTTGPRLALEVDVVPVEASRATPVYLALDGVAKPFSTQTGPGPGRARFLVPLEGKGPWQGRVWTDGADALGLDNERFFTVMAPVVARVLVVDASDSRTTPSPAAYVEAAFAGRDPIAPKEARRLGADAVTQEDLASADLVYWIGSRSANAGPMLKAYVEGGGSLVWLPAEPRAPDAPLASLLGAAIGRPEATDEGVTLDPGGYTSDLLAAFEGGTAGDLARPVFRQRLTLEAGEGATAVRFTDGRAAILSRPLGRGWTVALAAGPGKDWGDLATRPEFVVLAHSLVDALTRSGNQRQANRVIGRSGAMAVSGPSQPGNFEGPLADGTPSDARSGRFSVNLWPGETARLAPEPDRLTSAFAPGSARRTKPSQLLDSKEVAPPQASGLGAWFVLPLMGVVLMETLVASGRKARGRRQPNSP